MREVTPHPTGHSLERRPSRAPSHTLTHAISLGDEGSGRRPGGVRAKVRLGHVNARLHRRRSISPAVRTSAEKDPPRTRERTSARVRITGVLVSAGASNSAQYIPLNVSQCALDRRRSSTRRRRIRAIVFRKRTRRCSRRARSRGVKWTLFAFGRPPRRRDVPPEWNTIRLYRIFHSLERAVVRLCGSGYRGQLRASRTATRFDDDSFTTLLHLNERQFRVTRIARQSF